MDDQLIEKVSDDALDFLTLSHEELAGGLRRLTQSGQATPLLCGTSLRNVGVQPLMDAIVTYLPGPLQNPQLMYVSNSATSTGCCYNNHLFEHAQYLNLDSWTAEWSDNCILCFYGSK